MAILYICFIISHTKTNVKQKFNNTAYFIYGYLVLSRIFNGNLSS